MNLIDSHCHVQMPQYDSDREDVLRRSKDIDLGLICVGTDLETSQKALELANKHSDIWASVGLHPNDVTSDFRLSTFNSLLAAPKVVAVGEVGLDYYRTTDPIKQKLQREVFQQFLELALKHNKPLIIHCRDAHADMIEILSHHKPEALRDKPTGVIHSFTGTITQAQKYLDLGFYIGFNGIVTFARNYDDLVKAVPVDRILLETDAPFLSPIPYRGKRNEPSYLPEIAKQIEELRGLKKDVIATQATKNAKVLFKI